MPKRVVDGEALWRSKKLLSVPVEYRGEYANLLPLAEENTTFECDPHLVWSRVYAYNRPNITPEITAQILDCFVAADMIERFSEDGRCFASFRGMDKPGRLPGPAAAARKPNLPPLPPSLRENLPLESIIREKCEEIFNEVEDKKFYAKELKAAIKRKGYDALREAFEIWITTGYVGRKPITAFLKSLDSIPLAGPVTSPALQNVEEAIALLSDNQVFFHTSQKAILAVAIKDHGEDAVITAFRDFWGTVSSDRITFAGMNFVQQVNTRIRATQAKLRERELAAQRLEESLAEVERSAALELEALRAEEEEIEEEL